MTIEFYLDFLGSGKIQVKILFLDDVFLHHPDILIAFYDVDTLKYGRK